MFHRRRDTMKGFFKQVLKMGEARATLARLHPEMTGLLHLVPAAGVAVLALTLALAPFFAAAAAALAWLAVLGVGFYSILAVSAFCRAKRLAVALLAGFCRLYSAGCLRDRVLAGTVEGDEGIGKSVNG